MNNNDNWEGVKNDNSEMIVLSQMRLIAQSKVIPLKGNLEHKQY